MNLTTIDRVKQFDSPSFPDDRDDFKVQLIIDAISKKVETFLDRDLLYTERTTLFNIDKFEKPYIWLNAYPVETSDDALPARTATQQDVDEGYATSVGESIPATPNTLGYFTIDKDGNEFALTTEVVNLDASEGVVQPTQYEQLETQGWDWTGGNDLIQWGYDKFKVVSWGGLARTTDDFIAAYPDIEYEVIQQVLFDYKRSRNITQISVGAGGNSSESYVPFTLREELKRTLRPYRRIARV